MPTGIQEPAPHAPMPVETSDARSIEGVPLAIRRVAASSKWLAEKVAGAIVGALFLAVVARLNSAAGNWEIALRIGLVTVVPMLILMQLGPALHAQVRASGGPVSLLSFKALYLIPLILLVFMPNVFAWTGNPHACLWALFGGGAGLLVAFVAFATFIIRSKASAQWFAKQRWGWRPFYRVAAAIFVFLGAAVGLALS